MEDDLNRGRLFFDLNWFISNKNRKLMFIIQNLNP